MTLQAIGKPHPVYHTFVVVNPPFRVRADGRHEVVRWNDQTKEWDATGELLPASSLKQAYNLGYEYAGWRYLHPHPDRLTTLLDKAGLPQDGEHRAAFDRGYDEKDYLMALDFLLEEESLEDHLDSIITVFTSPTR